MARVLMASALVLSLLSGSQVKAITALDDPCTTAAQCDDTIDITCDLGVGGTGTCKKKIDQSCGGTDDCPVSSACTNDKCKCNDGYVVVSDICEKENGATTLAVPSMLLTLSVIVGLSFFSMAPF